MKLLDLSTIDHPETHASADAVQIGVAADGRPLFAAKPGFEPATAYDLSLAGNWIEARVEFPAAAVANPRAEVLFPPPPAPEEMLGLNTEPAAEPVATDELPADEAAEADAPADAADAPAAKPKRTRRAAAK